MLMVLLKRIRHTYLYWKNKNLWKYNDDTPKFNLTGFKCVCRVTRVIHGDMINVVAKVNGSVQRFTIMMEGYISPHIDDCEGNKKQLATSAHSTLTTLVIGKLLNLEINNQVGDFYCGTLTNLDGLCINQEMVLRRLGIPDSNNKMVEIVFDT